MDLFDESWFSALGSHVHERPVAEGHVLFRRGDRTFGIFAIRKGRVRLVRYTSEGSTVVLHVASRGDTFAEAALFSEVYHCDAVADVPSCIAVIPKDALLKTFAADPVVAMAFMARLAGQVQGLRSRLEIRNIRSATERVRCHLLLTCRGPESAVTFERPLKDVAAEIGLTHEAFYRALSALEAKGEIERSRRTIRLTAAHSAED